MWNLLRQVVVFILCVGLLIATAAPFALAQSGAQRLSFEQGRSSIAVRAAIRGYESMSYLVNVRAGQRIAVTMETSNPSSAFNILRPRSADAVFNGSISGIFSDIIVPQGGDYVVQVYLMRNAARRNERARFTLRIEVTGGTPVFAPEPSPDYADGLTGGPDYWEVAGVDRGDWLNVRARPSARSAILVRLRNGAILRNLGCRMNGQTRWCRVETRDGRASGWAAGRYLIEAGG